MGVMCEVFIANRERALKYSFCGECKCESWRSCKCWDEYAAETYDHVASHRVYDYDFAQLLSVLRGKKHKDAVVKEFKVIKKFSEEGPWIQKVPMDLPELLASLTSDELKAVAKKWAELKVLSLAFPIPKDKKFNKLILDYLKLLHKLSKKSVKLEQPMYLWTCL
jgi:hypothetical protein